LVNILVGFLIDKVKKPFKVNLVYLTHPGPSVIKLFPP
jgi:hypothetical protein